MSILLLYVIYVVVNVIDEIHLIGVMLLFSNGLIIDWIECENLSVFVTDFVLWKFSSLLIFKYLFIGY